MAPSTIAIRKPRRSSCGSCTATDDDLLALDDAIDRLASKYPQVAELVKLRFFAGMTLDAAAETLRVSLRTANRQWAFARAWLAPDLASD